MAAADMRKTLPYVLLWMLTWAGNALALVIPEDRADAMYHAYDGGGVTVNGPSILVRKGYKEKVSGYANYYQDFVSSASIDVLTSGSKYSEERTEYSMGVDYLADRDDAKAFLKKTPVNFPVLLDAEGKVVDLYKNQAMPSSYFVDRKGNLVHLHQGYRPGEEADYKKVIKKLLAQ